MTNTDKALLLAEWGWPPSTCPVCRSSGTGAAHQPNCAMDLALAERGYALQEDRSRGREFVKGQFAPTLPPPAAHNDSDSSDPNFDADPDDGGD